MAEKPVVFILHGDDEFAIAEYTTELENRMGDPATAGMNTTRLDGNSFSMDALVTATHAMPFLTKRRLVLLADPLGRMTSPTMREKFIAVLEQIPGSAALVLIIHHPLVSEQDRRKKPPVKHWLEKWAEGQGARVYLREFPLPHGSRMVRWVQDKAVALGGEFSYQAAGLLASLVAEDPRLAVQEIQKLLAYVNYNRPVEADDVECCTPYAGVGNVFNMVDALGNRNGQLAIKTLHRLLEEDDPHWLFAMIVRQFRLLLQTRELLNAGYREAEIARQLKTHLFVVRKLIPQSGHFSMAVLEDIMRRLLDVDQAIKTSQVEWEVALDTLVTTLTA